MNNTMSQQSSVHTSTPNTTRTALTEREWENFAAMKLRGEIDRMDATAATASSAKAENEFTLIDSLLYKKAWVASGSTAHKRAETTFEN
jgi:hypothetical protein